MNIGEFGLDPAAFRGMLPKIHFELAPNELPTRDGARAIVREALIPFVVWPDVPVRVLEPRQLGRMEMFLLESAIALNRFNLWELEYATGIPARVFGASASKLLQRGTFVETTPGEYTVDTGQANQILANKNVEEEHHRLVTFIYFPRQDIVLANAEIAGQLLGVSKKLRAPGQAPFATHIDRRLSVPEFLASRIVNERIFGFAHRLLGVDPWSKPPLWPTLSPCYYGRGHVDGEGDNAIANLQIWGYPRRKSASREYHYETVRLAGAWPLIREWVSLTDDFLGGFRGFLPGLPALSTDHMESLTSCHWRMGVVHEEARALSVDRWLTDNLTISICSPTAKVDIRISFEPMDKLAAELFALDAVAQRVDGHRHSYSEADLANYIRAAYERYPLSVLADMTRARVEERLWSRRRFATVYQLRANEDFAYA